jgi:Cu+-exporting ATPase
MTKKADIKVSGMHCATCTITVEKALRGVEGVEDAAVNLNSEIASVRYDEKKTNIENIAKAIESAGYGAVADRATLQVGGMHCATCVKIVERTLKSLDGVYNAVVNLGTEKAYVTYDSRLVGIGEMKKAIEGAGYQFLGVEGEERDEGKSTLVRIVAGFSFAIPMMILMLFNIHIILTFSQCSPCCRLCMSAIPYSGLHTAH